MLTNSKVNKRQKSLLFIFLQEPFICAHLLARQANFTCRQMYHSGEFNVMQGCVSKNCTCSFFLFQLISKFKCRKLIHTNEYFQSVTPWINLHKKMRFSNYSKKLETIEYWYKNPLKSAFVSLLYLDCQWVSSVFNPCSEG